MQLFMGHTVPCLHFIERENIFSSCVSSTQFFFKTWFMSFYLSSPPLFFPKTCFVFPIFMGGEIFFNLCGSQGSCCSSQRELFLFSLTLLRMFSIYHLIRQSLSIHDKRGEIQMKCENMCESCLFCLGGDTLIVYDSGKYKYVWQIQVCFDVSNLGGELVCIFVVFLFLFSTHAFMRFVQCFKKYTG